VNPQQVLPGAKKAPFSGDLLALIGTTGVYDRVFMMQNFVVPVVLLGGVPKFSKDVD
jgi:hypothetical protein